MTTQEKPTPEQSLADFKRKLTDFFEKENMTIAYAVTKHYYAKHQKLNGIAFLYDAVAYLNNRNEALNEDRNWLQLLADWATHIETYGHARGAGATYPELKARCEEQDKEIARWKEDCAIHIKDRNNLRDQVDELTERGDERYIELCQVIKERDERDKDIAELKSVVELLERENVRLTWLENTLRDEILNYRVILDSILPYAENYASYLDGENQSAAEEKALVQIKKAYILIGRKNSKTQMLSDLDEQRVFKGSPVINTTQSEAEYLIKQREWQENQCPNKPHCDGESEAFREIYCPCQNPKTAMPTNSESK